MQTQDWNRRKFIGMTTALTAASLQLAASRCRARSAVNDRIQVAVIGLGSRGTQVLKEFLQQPAVQVVAVCDVHGLHYRDNPWGKGAKFGSEPARQLVLDHYADQTKAGTFRGCNVWGDYRQMLRESDLDAVVVATPDHWHAKITVDALRSGLDVYCEKPVTHYFAEGQVVVREVANQQAVFQVGSQQRSDPLFRRAVEVVRNGHLGQIRRVEVGLPPGYEVANDDTTPAELPDGLDYELWCGPAAKLPYARAWHHRWWRAVRAFGGGVLMDWIGHHNDIAHWGLDQSTGGPESVDAVGWSKSQCPQYDTPADYEIRMRYAGGIESFISTKLTQGTKWIGDEGWLWVNRGKMEASDARWLAPDFKAGDWQAFHSPGHVENFVDAVRSRSSCVTSAEIGHRSITPGHLAYVSHQLGRPLKWDAVHERILDDAEAHTLLLTAPYRAPWALDEEPALSKASLRR